MTGGRSGALEPFVAGAFHEAGPRRTKLRQTNLRQANLRQTARAAVTASMLALFLAANARAAETHDPFSLLAPGAARSLRGRLVSRVAVQVDAAPWTTTDGLPSAPPVIGRPFREDEAEGLLRAVLGTGAYADGAIEASQDGDQVLLTLRLVSRRIVDSLEVTLDGAGPNTDEIQRFAHLVPEQALSSRDATEAVKRVEIMLERRGFVGALVRLTATPTARGLRMAFRLAVSGATERPVTAARMDFDRDLGPMEARLRENLPAIGARIDDERLRVTADSLQEELRSQGYFEAIVDVQSSGTGAVRFGVRPGALFRLKFEGVDRFDEDALRQLADFGTREGRDGAHLSEVVAAFYGARGYLDVEVRAEVRRSLRGHLADLVIVTNEHERVPIMARSFPHFDEDMKGVLAALPRTVEDLDRLATELLQEDLPGLPFFRPATDGGLPGQAVRSAVGDVTIERIGTSFFRPAYDRVRQYIEESYRNEGFLQAQAGPLVVSRKPCATPSPLGCEATPTGDNVSDGSPVESLPACDPHEQKSTGCERGVGLSLPVILGPRTYLADVAFTGLRAMSEVDAAHLVDLRLGDAASTAVFQVATDRLVEHYRELGYFFASARFLIDTSSNAERGRVRFEVNEGPLVIVDAIVIQGNESLSEDLLRRRLSLQPGEPFRTSFVRKSREAVAALPAVANVTIGLEEDSVPASRQRVIVSIREAKRQIVEVRPGASTGEGYRSSFEYTHRNILSYGISASTRIQLSYLPDLLLLDSVAKENIGKLEMVDRLVARVTAGVAFPDLGLGNAVRGSFDVAVIRDLQRDFRLDKRTIAATLSWVPTPALRISVGPAVELNTIRLFVDANTVEDYLKGLAEQTGQVVDVNLIRLLRIPNGSSTVIAQKLQVSYDLRDNGFNAHRGFFASCGVEHVDSFPDAGADGKSSFEGHFFKLTQNVSAYVPLPFGITWATQLRLGQVAHLTSLATSKTYPDRLFFLGGMDSVRGYLQDAFVPQDIASELEANANLSLANVVSRGGNLFVNPRTELRIPISGMIGTVAFLDGVNLWQDPFALLDHLKSFSIRATAGTGLRVDTPLFPIAIDVGWNLAPRRWEDRYAYHFAVGLF